MTGKKKNAISPTSTYFVRNNESIFLKNFKINKDILQKVIYYDRKAIKRINEERL